MRLSSLALATLLLPALACVGPFARTPDPDAPAWTGPFVGEVRPDSALVWLRAPGVRELSVRVRATDGSEAPREHALRPDPDADHAARIVLSDLRPDTRYEVRAGPRVASFRTAPGADAARALRLVWGGDVGGQDVCRDRDEGFPIFDALRGLAPALFIGLGDMVYADDVCTETGRYGNAQLPGDFPRSTELEHFRAHWRYALADPALARLLTSTAYLPIWDDHEVTNDFGAAAPLLPLGLRAFRDANPVAAAGAPLYRRFRWGRHAEIFVLDTRSYRDPAARRDDAPTPKTLLGAAQRAWLRDGLVGSDATWKIIVTSVPLTIPTGRGGADGRDGWADFGEGTGYERELLGLLAALRDAGVNDTLWLSTDVHFASLSRLVPFPDAPDFRAWELVTGPLHAGLFPKRDQDTTLRPERLFFWGPRSFDAVRSWDEAKRWFNFGVLDIGTDGRLAVRVRDTTGRVLFERTLPR